MMLQHGSSGDLCSRQCLLRMTKEHTFADPSLSSLQLAWNSKDELGSNG